MIAVWLFLLVAAPSRAAKLVEVPRLELGAQARPISPQLGAQGLVNLPVAAVPTATNLETASAQKISQIPSIQTPKIDKGPSAKADLRQSNSDPARFDAPFKPGAAFGEVLSPDEIVNRGWQLARQSKSQRARFGALVVDKDGRVIGEGWNRQSTKAERRLLGVGIIIHAEQVALAQAYRRMDGMIEGARVYAVGISKDAQSYAQKISPAFACESCARILTNFKVGVMSSSAKGFREIAWDKLKDVVAANRDRKWWQASYKGKAQDPNIRWLPIADVHERIKDAAVYRPGTTPKDLRAQLDVFRAPNGKRVKNGVGFRTAGVKTPQVLTLRIKRFFFDKILSGEKKFEFRARSPQNDALIQGAIQRGAKFLRLHFQDNDVQLLAEITSIDVVSGAAAAEPWDKEQGTEPGDVPHWRIAIRRPMLIWNNDKSRR